MGQLFLGKWWHWLLLAIIAGLLWQAGAVKMHVTHFNWFVMLILAGTIIGIIVLIKTTKSGEQITREELRDPDDSEENGSA